MIDDTFTPERIARLRKAWSGEDPVSSAFCAALDAIENERMFNSDQEAQLRDEIERLAILVRQAKGEAIRDTEKSEALLRADLAAFELIALKEGAYNRDPLKHAASVIDEAAAVATERADKLRVELDDWA